MNWLERIVNGITRIETITTYQEHTFGTQKTITKRYYRGDELIKYSQTYKNI